MKGRHNKAERVGLHFIAHAIEEEYGWVFREQPIADIGIDAFVEHCVDGNPSGKFLALQIKSGLGNVHENSTSYTYYISNTHYYYWTSLDFPIILLCYIKKKKARIHWVEIDKKLIKKTKRRWKIEIPKSQLLSVESYKKIERIVIKGKNKLLSPVKHSLKSDKEDIYRLAALNHANDSVSLLSSYQKIFVGYINDFNKNFPEIEKKGASPEVKFKLVKGMKNIRYALETLALRSYSEVNNFARLFSDFIQGAIQKYLIFNPDNFVGFDEELKNDRFSINQLYESFDTGIRGVSSLESSLRSAKSVLDETMFSSLDIAELSMNQVVEELNTGKELTGELLEKLDSIKTM